MSGKQMVNVSEGVCFRLRNVVSLHCVRRWAALDNAQAS